MSDSPSTPRTTVRPKHPGTAPPNRYHGEWGFEAQIFRETDFVIGRRFDLRELAVRWAEELRREIERGLLEDV